MYAAEPQPLQTVTNLASSLSYGNAARALETFDSQMAEYPQIAAAINALTAQAEISCSIDVLTDEGDETHRNIDLDWFMQLRSKAEDGPLVRRRERVHMRLEKHGKNWKIKELTPLTILAELKVE